MRKWVGSYLAVIAAILLQAQAASADAVQPSVLAMPAPLVPYTNAIMLNIAVVKPLLSPAQDPHHFWLSPSQALALEHADVLIVPDAGMTPLIDEFRVRYKHLRVIELSKLEGAEPLPYVQENPWLVAIKEKGKEKPEDNPSNTPRLTPKMKLNMERPDAVIPPPAVDPHFWLDPERMAALAPSLADALGDVFPGQRVGLQQNAQREAAHLRQDVMPPLERLIHETRAPKKEDSKPRLPFITYHAAYQYFLARFGLEHEGEITARPEDYLGAKTLDTLLNASKTMHIGCVIGEAQTPVVSRVVALSGAKLVILSPEQLPEGRKMPLLNWVHDDYDLLLYQTAKAFSDCL